LNLRSRYICEGNQAGYEKIKRREREREREKERETGSLIRDGSSVARYSAAGLEFGVMETGGF
jgi:hypothetical protein